MASAVDPFLGSAGADAFEADRQRRLSQAEGELKAFQEELAAATAALGQKVVSLFGDGKLAQPELLEICQREISPLWQRVAMQQGKVERIRLEQPPALHAAADDGRLCPACGLDLPSRSLFCPACGTQTVKKAPVPPAEAPCSQCGAPLGASARFCINCGAPATAAAPATRACPSCRTTIPSAAVFCPYCGAKLGALSVGAPAVVLASAAPAAEPEPAVPAPIATTPAGPVEPIPAPPGVELASPQPASVKPSPAVMEPSAAPAPLPLPAEPAPVHAASGAASLFCPACGMLQPPMASVCSNCGERLSEGRAAPPG